MYSANRVQAEQINSQALVFSSKISCQTGSGLSSCKNRLVKSTTAKTTPIATNTHEEIITYLDIFNDLFICVSISGAKVQQYFDIRKRLFPFFCKKSWFGGRKKEQAIRGIILNKGVLRGGCSFFLMNMRCGYVKKGTSYD